MNRPHQLRRCLRSIALQRHDSLEVVVVNDGGLDPATVVEEFTDVLDVRLISHPRNTGRSAALNTGVRAARGRYVCIVDDDDVLYGWHLAALVDEADRRGGAAVVHSHAVEAREQEDGAVAGRRLVHAQDVELDSLLVTNCLPILSVLVPRAALDDVGGFDQSLDVLEDWDCWIRLARRFPFVRLPRVTAEYRVPAAAASSTTREAPRHVAALERLFEKHPVPPGSPLADQREAARASVQPLADAYAYRYSVLVASGDDPEVLLGCLQSIIEAFAGQRYEVVVHAPPAPPLDPLLRALEEDVVVLVAHEADAEAAWAAGRRHAAGRVRLLLTSDDRVGVDVMTRCALAADGDEIVLAATA